MRVETAWGRHDRISRLLVLSMAAATETPTTPTSAAQKDKDMMVFQFWLSFLFSIRDLRTTGERRRLLTDARKVTPSFSLNRAMPPTSSSFLALQNGVGTFTVLPNLE
ncbi:hypothetical protein EYF80_029985 [Liparis tanakae]|uniref:Uncharacterized protein n=1 Tax=Liparis tanakae TaxID=230148 RepID=A0A4Z2H2V8_9TELE|nr:hypothetical protein EYF80_029985 [Liparis tanakae]